MPPCHKHLPHYKSCSHAKLREANRSALQRGKKNPQPSSPDCFLFHLTAWTVLPLERQSERSTQISSPGIRMWNAVMLKKALTWLKNRDWTPNCKWQSVGNRHVPQLGISTNLPLKLPSVLQSATRVLPSWCLLAFTRNHDPKSLRDICTPVSSARWDHGTLLLRLIWAALRGCTQATLYSRLQEH